MVRKAGAAFCFAQESLQDAANATDQFLIRKDVMARCGPCLCLSVSVCPCLPVFFVCPSLCLCLGVSAAPSFYFLCYHFYGSAKMSGVCLCGCRCLPVTVFVCVCLCLSRSVFLTSPPSLLKGGAPRTQERTHTHIHAHALRCPGAFCW